MVDDNLIVTNRSINLGKSSMEHPPSSLGKLGALKVNSKLDPSEIPNTREILHNLITLNSDIHNPASIKNPKSEPPIQTTQKAAVCAKDILIPFPDLSNSKEISSKVQIDLKLNIELELEINALKKTNQSKSIENENLKIENNNKKIENENLEAESNNLVDENKDLIAEIEKVKIKNSELEIKNDELNKRLESLSGEDLTDEKREESIDEILKELEINANKIIENESLIKLNDVLILKNRKSIEEKNKAIDKNKDLIEENNEIINKNTEIINKNTEIINKSNELMETSKIEQAIMLKQKYAESGNELQISIQTILQESINEPEQTRILIKETNAVVAELQKNASLLTSLPKGVKLNDAENALSSIQTLSVKAQAIDDFEKTEGKNIFVPGPEGRLICVYGMTRDQFAKALENGLIVVKKGGELNVCTTNPDIKKGQVFNLQNTDGSIASLKVADVELLDQEEFNAFREELIERYSRIVNRQQNLQAQSQVMHENDAQNVKEVDQRGQAGLETLSISSSKKVKPKDFPRFDLQNEKINKILKHFKNIKDIHDAAAEKARKKKHIKTEENIEFDNNRLEIVKEAHKRIDKLVDAIFNEIDHVLTFEDLINSIPAPPAMKEMIKKVYKTIIDLEKKPSINTFQPEMKALKRNFVNILVTFALATGVNVTLGAKDAHHSVIETS